MTKLKSEGKCVFCDKLFDQSAITKHLETHLKKFEEVEKKLAFHVKVEADEFFLNLLVDGNATFQVLDDFLRNIWLECCNHMSGFDGSHDEIDWSEKMETVFEKGFKTTYTYDYGTSTVLKITVAGEHLLAVENEIQLLSRNEPLQLLCHKCKKETATSICTVHVYEGAFFFCKKCEKLHKKECEDFNDYAQLPTVNSPRCGECGYTGGVIDLERDGVYKSK